MIVSYLDKGLSRSQLLIQKTLSNIKDHEIREEVMKKFKSLENLEVPEYINFIETHLAMRQASGKINMQKGVKKTTMPNKRPYPDPLAMCKRCKSDRDGRHLQNNCEAKWCSKCTMFFHTADRCIRKKQPTKKKINKWLRVKTKRSNSHNNSNSNSKYHQK